MKHILVLKMRKYNLVIMMHLVCDCTGEDNTISKSTHTLPTFSLVPLLNQGINCMHDTFTSRDNVVAA